MISLNGFDVGKVWDYAVKILKNIGLKVENEKILRECSKQLKCENGRVKFSDEIIENFKSEIQEKAKKYKFEEKKLVIYNSRWNHYYVEPETYQIKPFDKESLIKYTKLCCALKDDGLIEGGVAGYSLDVPPEIQFIISFYVDCCYNKNPSPFGIYHTKETMEPILAISKVMDLDVVVNTEPISPLNFRGNSIDIAVELFSQKPKIYIDPIPIIGVTAPLDWHAGWAQSVAENLGSYIIFRTYGFEDVEPPSFRLFLPNMVSGTTYFSSPQSIFALLTRRKVRHLLGLTTNFSEFMLVTAKLPDSQAIIEKTAGMLLAKMHDFYEIEGAGSLSMDEIFSPQQLIIDIEIRNYVENIKFNPGEIGTDILELINEGLETQSFLAADLTLENYSHFIWHPLLFDLSTRAKWIENPKEILAKANEIAEEKIKKYDYELTGEKRKELEKIIRKRF